MIKEKINELKYRSIESIQLGDQREKTEKN